MTERDTSDRWLRRVRALLAKAESTDFPDEAEALIAKAQALMSRHAIDDALLRGATASGRAEVLVRTVRVEPPYAGPMASLLGSIARANGCRMVVARAAQGRRLCTVVGYEGDLDHVAVLFAALSCHATRAMLRTTHNRGDGIRAFRHAFLLGYAMRIGARLREAGANAVTEAEQTIGPAVALVIRDRAAAVDEVLQAKFPWLVPSRSHASSWSGLRRGREAANGAALGGAPLQAPRQLGSGA